MFSEIFISAQNRNLAPMATAPEKNPAIVFDASKRPDLLPPPTTCLIEINRAGFEASCGTDGEPLLGSTMIPVYVDPFAPTDKDKTLRPIPKLDLCSVLVATDKELCLKVPTTTVEGVKTIKFKSIPVREGVVATANDSTGKEIKFTIQDIANVETPWDLKIQIRISEIKKWLKQYSSYLASGVTILAFLALKVGQQLSKIAEKKEQKKYL